MTSAPILARDHYAMILLAGQEHLSDDSLDTIHQQLDQTKFLRVHRSAIVNVEQIKALRHEGDRKYVAVLADDAATEVPVSRDRLDAIKERLGIK